MLPLASFYIGKGRLKDIFRRPFVCFCGSSARQRPVTTVFSPVRCRPAGKLPLFPLPVQSCGRTACVWMPKFCVFRCLKRFGILERRFRAASVYRCGRRRFQTAVSVCLVGRKAFISLSFFYGASRFGTAITATICAVSCYNPPALPIRPSEAHVQTASTKEKTNHEPIPLARCRQPAARPAPAG